MATILVTDGEQRSALAIVRSLGRAGHRCVVLSGAGRSLAGRSRYSARDASTPDPGSAPEDFVRAVTDLVAEERVDLVIPVTEEALFAILARAGSIGAMIPFPDLPTFQVICDKSHVLRVAESVGIRVPEQFEIRSRDRVSTDARFPLVLKPSRSVHTAPDGTRAKAGVSWALSAMDVDIALRAYPDSAFPILAQETIVGPGIGVFLLIRDGRVLARFAHRRILEKPPAGGVSVLSRSEPMDEELYDLSVRLLNAMDWSGVAMVEYKRDSRTGEPVLMEINGRFWGSLQLAIDAGVDFPRLLAEAALGSNPSPVLDYRPASMRWEWGHVDHVLARWRTHEASWRDRGRALTEWLGAFRPGIRNEVLRIDDPRPFLWETGKWIREVLGR